MLLGALLWWQTLDSRGSGAGAIPIDMRDPVKIAQGQRVYATHCASCHGASLEGQPDWMSRLTNGRLPAPPHDGAGHTFHHSFRILFAITRDGLVPPYAPPGYQTDMPAFGDRLSGDEIWSVLAYIRSRWSDRVRMRHDELERQVRAQQQ